jgi:hypothetical protein
MAKGIMDVYACAVCGASWCCLVRRGRPAAYCGPECQRAGKSAQRRAQRLRGLVTRLPAPRPSGGPVSISDRPGKANTPDGLVELLVSGYHVESGKPTDRPGPLPERLRYPGLKAGPDEGRTSSKFLRVLGSNRPWNECG